MKDLVGSLERWVCPGRRASKVFKGSPVILAQPAIRETRVPLAFLD